MRQCAGGCIMTPHSSAGSPERALITESNIQGWALAARQRAESGYDVVLLARRAMRSTETAAVD